MWIRKSVQFVGILPKEGSLAWVHGTVSETHRDTMEITLDKNWIIVISDPSGTESQKVQLESI